MSRLLRNVMVVLLLAAGVFTVGVVIVWLSTSHTALMTAVFCLGFGALLADANGWLK